MKKTNLFFLLLSFVFLTACVSSESSQEEEEMEIIEEQEEVTETEEETQEETAETDAKIVWKNWYLSVPIDRADGSGKATSIYYEDIESGNLSSQEAKYFYQNEDGSYTMYTQFTGYTTSGQATLDGGKYCRTELREYWQGNQDTDDNWSMATGTHILETTLKVDFVEGNGRTIVAQIHGKETDGVEGSPATIKIRWNSGQIQLDYYTKPDEGELWTSAFDTKKDVGDVGNEVFTFKIKIENGKFYYGLTCQNKNIDTDYTLVYDYVGNGYKHENYFKTGNYFNWNEDYEKAAQVTLYEVKTEHLD